MEDEIHRILWVKVDLLSSLGKYDDNDAGNRIHRYYLLEVVKDDSSVPFDENGKYCGYWQ